MGKLKIGEESSIKVSGRKIRNHFFQYMFSFSFTKIPARFVKSQDADIPGFHIKGKNDDGHFLFVAPVNKFTCKPVNIFSIHTVRRYNEKISLPLLSEPGGQFLQFLFLRLSQQSGLIKNMGSRSREGENGF